MSTYSSSNPVTISTLNEMKVRGEKIACLTAYDATFSALESSCGVEVILVGDSEFISDEGGGRSPENQIFVLNSIDYLIGDKDLIALRSREITSRPLAEIEDSSRKTWKWFNIIAPTFLIVGFGFLRLRNQKSKSSNLEDIYG